MEEIDSFSKKHPRQTMVVGGGTSIFLIVVIMMGIYIAFDGKIPTINIPVSFPVENKPIDKPPVSYTPLPASYTGPISFATNPLSYP